MKVCFRHDPGPQEIAAFDLCDRPSRVICELDAKSYLYRPLYHISDADFRSTGFAYTTISNYPCESQHDPVHTIYLHFRIQTLILNASSTIDEDRVHPLPFTFEWKCADPDGGTCTSPGGNSLNIEQFAEGDVLEIPAGYLAAGMLESPRLLRS